MTLAASLAQRSAARCSPPLVPAAAPVPTVRTGRTGAGRTRARKADNEEVLYALPCRLACTCVTGEEVEGHALVGDLRRALRPLDGAEIACLNTGSGGCRGHPGWQQNRRPGSGARACAHDRPG